MAVAFVRTHTGVSTKTAGTTVDLSISTATTPGNLLVAYILFDNAGVASKPVVSAIAKAAGETASWVFLGAARSTSTSSGAFSSAEIWAIKTTVSWAVTTYAVTLDTSVTMRATVVQEFSGVGATLRSTAGTAYSTTTTAASGATTGTTPAIGDLALGLIFGSNVAAAQAGDNDTTGGAWSAVAGVGSSGGSGTTNNFGIAQYKILTGANHQTLNNSAAMTAGNGAVVAILQAYIPPTITQAAYRFYADGTESGATALAAQDTGYTADLSSGDVNLAVRVRLQSTNTVPIDATDDFQLEWEKNASGTWNSVDGPVSLAATYPSSNWNGGLGLHGTTTAYAQSFLGDGKRLARAGFYLAKNGSPDGTITAALFAHTGTFGTDGLPTGTALATSTTTVATGSVGTSPAWWYFDFDRTFALAAGTPYEIAITGTITTTGINNISVGADSTAPSHAGTQGNRASGGTWSAPPAPSDMIFEVYTGPATDPSTILPYGSSNLTDAAATTSRLTGGSNSFVAGEVSEDGRVDDLGWSANNHTEVLYSLTLKAADLANADVLRLRVCRYDIGGAKVALTYSQTPTITVAKAGGAELTHATTDPLGLTDTVLPELTAGGAFTHDASNPVGLTDTAAAVRVLAYDATDTLGLTDTRATEATLVRTDTETLTDTRAADTGLARSDPVTVTDQGVASRSLSADLSDRAGLSDTVSIGTFAVSFTDAVNLTDSVNASAAGATSLDLSDVIGVADSAQRTAAFLRSFTDPAGLTDSRALASALTRAELAGLLDTATAELVGVAAGGPKVWTGTGWAAHPAKVWTGTAWVTKPAKVWTGSEWKPLA